MLIERQKKRIELGKKTKENFVKMKERLNNGKRKSSAM